MHVTNATSDEQIARCFPAMLQLRPHLDREGFLDQVRRQITNHDYRLVYIEDNAEVTAVAGYRFAEYLAWGRILYVDDLITHEEYRGRGFGSFLMDWLIDEAQKAGCAEFHLDSGVQRFDAHRLYLSKRMNIRSHHFSREF